MSNVNGSESIWWRLTHLEPVVYRTFVVALFTLLVTLGLETKTELPDAVTGFVVALAAIIQVVWVRRGVIPESKVVTYLDNPVENSADLQAGQAITTANPNRVIEASQTRLS